MYKTLMIVNLEAGKGNFEEQLSYIVMELKNKKFDVVIKYTEKDYSADKILRNYKTGYDLLIICGGDGTLKQAVTELTNQKRKVSVAFFPIGAINDFAKTLELPKKGITIAQNILNSKAIQTDTGKFNKTTFNYVAAFGAFSEIAYETNQESKKKFGKFAYYINIFKSIKNIKPKKLKIYFDNEIIEDKYIYGSISNSNYIGGIKFFKKDDIILNDGKMEVLLIKKPKNIFGYLGIFKSILTKNYSTDRNILYSQDSELKIESKEEISWVLDGEFGGEFDKVEFKVIPKNIEFLIM